MNADIVNALFEAIGGCLIWINVYRLHIDKRIAGVSMLPTAFFSAWGIWNLWFYPAVGAWWSFLGGISIVIANSVWWWQMLKYRKNPDESVRPVVRLWTKRSEQQPDVAGNDVRLR